MRELKKDQIQRAELISKMEEYEIPPHMVLSLVDYIMIGRPVGSFLAAVLSNNLMSAVANADDQNVHKLPEYTKFLYNNAPMMCWGSTTNVQNWIEQGGMVGLFYEEESDLNDIPPGNDGYW
jgi:hypothetical protein